MKAAAFAALALAAAQCAFGQVAYSSFGPDHLCNSNSIAVIGTPGYAEVAMRFTAQASGGITAVTFGLWANTPDTAVLGIYADTGGAPTTLLGSWPINVPVFPGTGTQPPWTQALNGSVSLTAGTSYYFSIVSPDASQLSWAYPRTASGASEIIWRRNAFGNPSPWVGGIAGTPAAIDILVPSPGTGLVAISALLMVSRRRRHQRERRY
jgi:hypothetical protein